MFTKSYLYKARCPAAKHATVSTTLSKYVTLVAIDTWRSWRIEQLAKNALDVCYLEPCAVSLSHSIPPESVRKGHGEKNHSSIIMVLNKIAQQPLHGTTIVPHDGQQSSMMNEKLVQKKPGVDHPIASVDDLGAYEVAHGNFLHKKNQVSSLNKELANDSLYMRSLPQNGICPTESSQAMISLDQFDMRSAVLRFILDIASCQSPLTTGTQPTIERSILLLTMSNLES